MKTLKPFFGWLILLMIFSTTNLQAQVPVTGVSLNKTDLSLNLYGTEQLVATVSPSNATNQNVNWSSTNTKIITVDDQGNVSADHDGVATITVQTADGGFTANCTVTVHADNAANIDVFSFQGESHETSISDGNQTVKGFMPHGTDMTNLTVGYQISPGSSINPLPELIHDYSNPVSFVVTAVDGTQKTWEVSAIVLPDLSGAQKVDITFNTAPQGWIGDTVSWVENNIYFHIGFPNPADTTWPPSAQVGTNINNDPAIGLFPARLYFYLQDTSKVIVAAFMYIHENCGNNCTTVSFSGDASLEENIPQMTREYYFYDLSTVKATQGSFVSGESEFGGISFWIANKDGSVNHSPVADAGPDQTVHSNDTVHLDGSGSFDPDHDAMTYQWTAPQGIILSSTTSVSPSFMAPNSMDTLHLTFTLSVTDGKSSPVSDDVVITVIPTNHIPVANAGPNQTVAESDSVYLDGTASHDADGDSLRFIWMAPGGIHLTDSTSATPAFLAPEIQQATTFSFALIVNDGLVNSVLDTVFITVTNINHRPVAWIDLDQIQVTEGDSSIVEGHYSYDSDGDSLSFHWWAQAGSGIGFYDSTAMDPRFGAPMVDHDTTFEVYLNVSDGQLFSEPDTAYIHVINLNSAPVAVLAQHTTPVFDNDTVFMDGSASYDPDHDSLTYNWILPKGINLNNSGATPWFIAPIVNKDTPYVILLSVNDGNIDSPQVADTIWVKHKNHVPVANTGYPIEIFEGDSAYLYGSLSYDIDGDSLSYSLDVPAGFWIADSTQADSRFSAPQVQHDTTFSLILTVFDGQLYSTPDTCHVTVKKHNQAPVAAIISTSQIFYGVSMNEGDTLWIDGSPSHDPDDDLLTYSWYVPKAFEFYHSDSIKTMIVAPEVQQATSFNASLTVSDGHLNSTVNFIIQVLNVNKAPVAQSGYPIEIQEGDSAYLYGSLSYDYDGDSLSYSWKVPAGFWIADSTQADSRFSAPQVQHDTTFSLILTVFDGQLYSTPDTCRVTVKNVNKVPVAAIVSTSQIFYGVSMNEGDTLWIDGSPSHDPDGDSLTYSWYVPKAFEFYHPDSIKTMIVAPEVQQTTSFDASLTVNDGTVNSPENWFIIQVVNVNKPPVADAGKAFRVLSGQQGQLNGSDSYDPDMDSLRYTWTAPTGIQVNDLHAMRPVFTAPVVTANETLTFSLVVSDGTLTSTPSTVAVTVEPLISTLRVSPYLNDTLLQDSRRHVSIYYNNGSRWIMENVLSYENAGISYFAVWQGQWMISVDPLDDSAGFVSTFSGDVAYWAEENAFSVTAGVSVNQDIHLISVARKLTGDGLIDGVIYRDPDTTTAKRSSINRLNENHSDLPPAEGVTIFLYQKADDALLASRLTDENGKFAFDNLPNAIYYLSVQLPGYDENSHWDVTVSDTTTQVDSVNFVINEAQGSVTDIPQIGNMQVRIYPNPTRHFIQIQTDGFLSSENLLQIIDITGHVVFTKRITDRYNRIDVNNLTRGFYFIRISNQKERIIKKFLKQ